MKDQITKLGETLEGLAQIADELERQVAPCPVTRLLLIAWLTEWVRGPETQAALKRDLPCLPQSLKSAYAVWIHHSGGR
ncbi:hypothetical protein D3C76_460420 [compost metagenome]|jgi:hypothetical protein|uniref:hypothetical protein n=1 Tax=Pseudomonas TaxID=286 RepID=UPI00097C6306|nr:MULTISPECIES: hypothetical protein [Pseudomonas]MCH7300806.1 hypothetical protein [Pseudomonas capeferrum]MDD2062751.1 hypothetical protein [Pseudomonas sp. 25571]